MEIDIKELRQIIDETAQKAVSETLRSLGLEKLIYRQAEIIRTYGITIYRKSLMYVQWQKKGESRSSPMICDKAEFDNYLRKFNIELKPVNNART